MKSFESMLNEFDEVLRKYNSVNYERLYPPLDQSKLEAFFKKINMKNEDIKLLYKWKNGFDFNANINQRPCDIFFTGTLLSLNLIQQDILFNENEGTWRNTLFPLIGNEEREWLLLENKKSINYGKIFFYSPSIIIASQKPISCYDSVSNLIETTIEAYRSGIFQYNKDEDWLDKNIDKYFALAREKNPNSEFWKTEN